MADVGSTGTGAGTFSALLPIYRDADSAGAGAGASPPPTAAGIAIESGRPVLWSAVAIVLIFIAMLLRAALRRGRDAAFAAAGASCLVVAMLEAFCDASPQATAVAIVVAATLGPGIRQTKGRV